MIQVITKTEKHVSVHVLDEVGKKCFGMKTDDTKVCLQSILAADLITDTHQMVFDEWHLCENRKCVWGE